MPITPIHAMTRSSSIHITLFLFISFLQKVWYFRPFSLLRNLFWLLSISTVTTFYIESITNPSRLYKKYPGYSINSRMISLMISSSSGVSILLKWLPAAAVCRILSAICSTISSLEASSGFPAAGVSSVQILTCST